MSENKKITINISNVVYEVLLKTIMNNKIENSKKGLKGDSKKPETLSSLISAVCTKEFKLKT